MTPARAISKGDLYQIWTQKTKMILSRKVALREKFKELELFRLGFVRLRKDLERRGCLKDFL